jgi:hypothetical protein
MCTRLPLETAYQEYLESELASKAAEKLVFILRQSGLEVEAHALDTYSRLGPGVVCVTEERGDERSYVVSLDLPSEAKPGDLWFDPVELNMSVFIPNPKGRSEDVISWVSMHPVYVWQYRAFLNLVEIGKKTEIFPTPDDYLTQQRINGQSSLAYVTDIYQDEALAYSSWMRKSLSDTSVINAVRAYLSSEELCRMVPDTLKFWDSSNFQEEYRVAFGLNTLDKNPSLDYDDIIDENYNALESLPDRMLYEEWDHRSNIGMITSTAIFCGLSQDNTASSFYHDFLNRSPRPVLSIIS